MDVDETYIRSSKKHSDNSVSVFSYQTYHEPGPITQWVASQIADTGVVSSIPALPHTIVEVDYELFFYGHSSPSEEGRG